MSKRFTCTELWDKEWFMALKPEQKLMFMYVKDKCNYIGLWSPNRMLMLAQLFPNCAGTLDIDDTLELLKEHIEVMPDGKWWLVEFCDESLPYPDMIAEAARRASREIDSLQDELKLKTGEFDDASSVR